MPAVNLPAVSAGSVASVRPSAVQRATRANPCVPAPGVVFDRKKLYADAAAAAKDKCAEQRTQSRDASPEARVQVHILIVGAGVGKSKQKPTTRMS